MSALKIAIIGAGPAGLCLARLLQKNNIDCTVYEADSHRNARNQGGTLDLHPRAGQRALKEAGLFEDFLRHARPEGAAERVLRFDGHVLWDENLITETNLRPQGDEKPEIDRQNLQDILLDSIEPRRIRWDCKVSYVEYEDETKTKTKIHFADGSEETGIDILVGADGAWSKVRSLVTEVRPYYSGVSAVELWCMNASQTNPWLSDFVGPGSCYMFDEGRALMAQRMGNDSIRVYVCVRQPESWKYDCGIDFSDHSDTRQEMVRRYFHDCSDDLKRMILQTSDALVVRQLWMLPVGHTWEHSPSVTLLGDAAHLMTPFGGVGVNVALTDALALARALVSKKDGLFAKVFSDQRNISSALKEYENFMFMNGKENAEKTAEGLMNHFSKDGADHRANLFLGHYKRLTGKTLESDHFDRLIAAQ